MAYINCIQSIRPKYIYSAEEIGRQAEKDWFCKLPDKTARLARKIFKNAEIESRASFVSIDEVFSESTFEERNNIYKECMKDAGSRVLTNALEESGWKPEDIDIIISVSCTGFMIPSVDAYVIDDLGLRQDVMRLPVTEMGCAGGTAALIYANELLKGRPQAKIAILALEAPSLTLLKNDHSIENLVSAAIFSDGASCVLVSNEKTTHAPEIKKTEMYHFPNSTTLMGYNLRNDGLKIVLDREVPNAIIKHVPFIFDSFYKDLDFDLSSIDHLVFHPGGKKIVKAVEDMVRPLGKNLDCSKQVLKSFGNMSSATVIHVLELVQKEFRPENAQGHMLAFGPGFSAQSLLLKWS